MRSINDWEAAIVTLHVWMLSQWPDTLIARKCGSTVSIEASDRASAVLASADQNGILDRHLLEEFDRWLRADGHRRNPGTTADLIAATLFAALRDNLIEPPSRDELQQFVERVNAKANSK
jgi:triphosphoribosyl-dephospho-CoA synthase